MVKRIPLVYVAGPYTQGEPVTNVRNAILMGNEVLKLGAAPLVPHLTMLWQVVLPKTYQEWMDLDAQQLIRCDIVLRIPGPSAGADTEEQTALEHGIPIVYSLEELAEWLRLEGYA